MNAIGIMHIHVRNNKKPESMHTCAESSSTSAVNGNGVNASYINKPEPCLKISNLNMHHI